MIYFDNSATTAIHPAALDTYVKTSQRIIGNPSSLHRLGSQSFRLLEESRKQIANLLSVSPSEIYFTSGGTEGDNWVLKGTAIEKRAYGNHIIISAVEHPAVTNTAKSLEKQGFVVDIAPVDESGFIDVSKLEKLIKPETICVAVMAVNNEVGMIQPIKKISQILKNYPTIHFLVDAVQAIGKVSVEEWLTDRVDFATFSGHKFHGPRGVGFIYWKSGRRIAPLLDGGGQEKNQRSSTENVAGIAAMAKALRLEMADRANKTKRMLHIRAYLYTSLKKYSNVTVFSQTTENFAPHILCFALKGVRGEAMVHALENKEIFISTTSACSSKKKASSSTLLAMGIAGSVAECAVRISLGEQNTMAEAEQFLLVFNQLYQRFDKIN